MSTDWSNFFLGQLGAAAALTGLLGAEILAFGIATLAVTLTL